MMMKIRDGGRGDGQKSEKGEEEGVEVMVRRVRKERRKG